MFIMVSLATLYASQLSRRTLALDNLSQQLCHGPTIPTTLCELRVDYNQTQRSLQSLCSSGQPLVLLAVVAWQLPPLFTLFPIRPA